MQQDQEFDYMKSFEFLSKCVVVGQAVGSFSIKDAATLNKVIVNLKREGISKDELKSSLEILTKAIVIANGKGCYSLEDAELIDKTISSIDEYLASC